MHTQTSLQMSGSEGESVGVLQWKKMVSLPLKTKSYATTKGTIEGITAVHCAKLNSAGWVNWRLFPATIKATQKATLGPWVLYTEMGIKVFPLYSHSPHCSHLVLIFRPVKWPLLWCLQVSEERSAAGSSSVLLACFWLTLLLLFMLCKEAEEAHPQLPGSVPATNATKPLWLHSPSLHLSRSRFLCETVFKSAHSPLTSLCSLWML